MSVEITEEMEAPVYVYYEISNFYQNYQRYMVSYDSDQLLGENKDKEDLSGCSPLKSNGSLTLSPCGVVANSLFNDVISLKNDDVTLHETGIAWKSDVHKKFKQPDGFEWAPTVSDVSGCHKSVCAESVCTDAGLPAGCYGYVCAGGDFDDSKCDAGDDAVYYYRDHDEYQFLYQTFPEIVSPLVGVKNEHFVVWMRLAGLNDFRKLYGRVTETLKKGDVLEFEVANNFNVRSFNGQKHIVVSTVSPLGGNLAALWMAFTYFGVICCCFALAFLVKLHFAPRKLGDTAYLLRN